VTPGLRPTFFTALRSSTLRRRRLTTSTDIRRLFYMRPYSNLPIMPKEIRPAAAHRGSSASVPYPTATASTSGARNAAIWSAADDEILLQARASGLNWQPISSKHFPSKTANACRKRHERLIERRHVEDWDAQKLELLAHEYMACRKEMWEVLASRVGERWAVVEAKVKHVNHREESASTNDPIVHGERPEDASSRRSHRPT